jgi:hypothetical protein
MAKKVIFRKRATKTQKMNCPLILFLSKIECTVQQICFQFAQQGFKNIYTYCDTP